MSWQIVGDERLFHSFEAMPRASTPTTSSPDEAGASSGVPAPKQPTVGDVIGNWLGEKKAKVDSWVSEKHDDAIRTSTNNILDRVGPFVMRSIEDPYLPDFLKRALRAAFDKVWNEVRGELLNDMLRSYGWDSVYYEARLHRLRKWRDAPRLCKCCRPGYGCCGDPGCCGCVLHFFRALRARFLYADQPADGTAWKVLRDPLGLLIFTLKLHVATSVATFAIFFVLMDKVINAIRLPPTATECHTIIDGCPCIPPDLVRSRPISSDLGSATRHSSSVSSSSSSRLCSSPAAW